MSAGKVSLRELLGLGRPAQPEFWDQLQGRPAQRADEAYLRSLYASARADQMRATGWPPARCRAFLDEQFDFQQRHHDAHFPAALHVLMLLDGLPIGRLVWHSRPGLATLVDLCLAPSWRRRGIGGCVLGWLAERADRENQAITLQIEHDNEAGRLLRRHGFVAGPGHERSALLELRRAPAPQAFALPLAAAQRPSSCA